MRPYRLCVFTLICQVSNNSISKMFLFPELNYIITWTVKFGSPNWGRLPTSYENTSNAKTIWLSILPATIAGRQFLSPNLFLFLLWQSKHSLFSHQTSFGVSQKAILLLTNTLSEVLVTFWINSQNSELWHLTNRWRHNIE